MSILYGSRYCDSAGIVVANRQPVLAQFFNFDSLVNAAIGAVNFMKYTISINITEIYAGGLGRLDAGVGNAFTSIQENFSADISDVIC